jgi:hypothetical protein
MTTRLELFRAGEALIARWCDLNGVPPPQVEQTGDPESFGTCAYYRDGVIYISVQACARIGTAGRAWSYPGYVVDRTPYGVLAHELGHHVEGAHGPAGGIVARVWRQNTAEKPLTGYCPNDNEWFAEIFRLFITNPELLRRLRPATFALLRERWPTPAETRDWDVVLARATRQIGAALNKIRAVGGRGQLLERVP